MLKIALIAPGLISIPPKGWGAIETLVYDYSVELERQGYQVLIVNDGSSSSVINKVNAFNADVVHCHADNLIKCMPYINSKIKAYTSHFGYLESPHNFSRYIEDTHKPLLEQSDIYIFALSPAIGAMYMRDGIPSSRIRITPNGVNPSLFNFKERPAFGNKGICLAQISSRKRQYLIQNSNADIDFVGGINSYSASYRAGFNPTRRDYLGEWSREQVYQKLTDYGNLILLSDAEAHPLVCLEGLSAGLGLVVSEASSANLDVGMPFITVIPEEKLQDRDYLKAAIIANRALSINDRASIHAYAQCFDYKTIVTRYTAILSDIFHSSTSDKYAFHYDVNSNRPPNFKTKPRRFLPGLTSKITINFWKIKMKIRTLISSSKS
ncbi:hypothetical protein [Agrobacterium vaccinii]|uniref:hypothetical protein n=1 Tax=Agrobacterium vaccinii TaxID=2735528 RepID=UPI001E3F084D|nr:hypothetical protein [Agrobacterium vaccinii]UHS57110.1 hypothetical protein HRS00_09995 [Agrobacterium vaccinii]